MLFPARRDLIRREVVILYRIATARGYCEHSVKLAQSNGWPLVGRSISVDLFGLRWVFERREAVAAGWSQCIRSGRVSLIKLTPASVAGLGQGVAITSLGACESATSPRRVLSTGQYWARVQSTPLTSRTP